MTREEWIAEIPKSVFTAYELSFEQYANDACEQIDILVNCIIDDFENRTCESCRFFLGCGLENCNCENENSMGYTYPDLTKFDSCNKWEPKNDNR